MGIIRKNELARIRKEAPDGYLQLADAFEIYTERHGLDSAPNYFDLMLKKLAEADFFSYRFRGGAIPFRTPPRNWKYHLDRKIEDERAGRHLLLGAEVNQYGNHQFEGEYIKLADFEPVLEAGKPAKRGPPQRYDWDEFFKRANERIAQEGAPARGKYTAFGKLINASLEEDGLNPPPDKEAGTAIGKVIKEIADRK